MHRVVAQAPLILSEQLRTGRLVARAPTDRSKGASSMSAERPAHKHSAKRTTRAGEPGARSARRSSQPTSESSVTTKPSKTLPAAPPRTSGQSTPHDKPPSLPQETDKTAELRPDTLAPGERLTTNQGVAVSDD